MEKCNFAVLKMWKKLFRHSNAYAISLSKPFASLLKLNTLLEYFYISYHHVNLLFIKKFPLPECLFFYFATISQQIHTKLRLGIGNDVAITQEAAFRIRKE